MKAYVYQGDLICEDCAERVKERIPMPVGMDPNDESSWDSDEYPKGPYPDGGGESDCPQHCGHCGRFLENPLTDAGQEFVAEAIASGDGNPQVLSDWGEFYAR